MTGFGNLTLAQSQAIYIPGGKLVVVDGTNGNDSKGLRGSALRPFKTLAAAKTAAQSGDTIFVYPGSYTGNDLFKNGVHWHFFDGSVVTYSNSQVNTGSGDARGIFDDRSSGAVTCSISGRGVFDYFAGSNDGTSVAPNPNIRGAVCVQNSASDVRIECKEIRIGSFIEIENPNAFGVYVADCAHFSLKCDRIIDPNFGLLDPSTSYPSTASGVAFRWGKAFIEVDEIKVNMRPLHATQKVSPSGSSELHFRAKRVENYENVEVVRIDGGTTLDFKTVVDIEDGYPSSNANDFYLVYGGGKHSFHCQRVYTTAGSALANIHSDDAGLYDPEAFVQIDRGETGETLLLVGAVPVGNPKVTAVLPSFKSTGFGKAVIVYAGTVFVHGGDWKVLNNFAVQHNGGKCHIRGARIDSSNTNSSSRNPIQVTSSGLILDGCTLIAPALADSIFAASPVTVKIYGTTFANKAKSANVTVQAGLGTLVADSNVA